MLENDLIYVLVSSECLTQCLAAIQSFIIIYWIKENKQS